MMNSHVFIMILSTLLVFVWAQSRLAHMCSWRSHVKIVCSVLKTGHGSPCSTYMVTVEIWVTNALTMPLHLAHLDSSLKKTIADAGLVITLTLLSVLMAVITSARFQNDCNTFEQMQRRFTRTGSSVGSSHRVYCDLCALHVNFRHVFLLLSGFCPL